MKKIELQQDQSQFQFQFQKELKLLTKIYQEEIQKTRRKPPKNQRKESQIIQWTLKKKRFQMRVSQIITKKFHLFKGLNFKKNLLSALQFQTTKEIIPSEVIGTKIIQIQFLIKFLSKSKILFQRYLAKPLKTIQSSSVQMVNLLRLDQTLLKEKFWLIFP